MNKNTLITIIVLVLVAGGAFLFFNNSKTESEDQLIIEGQDELVSQQENDEDESEEMNENGSEASMNSLDYIPSETATNYLVTEGTSVSYSVQKRFLSKPTEEVIATTENVSGRGWFDLQNANGQVEIMLNVDDLVSSSAKRDDDIMALFLSKDVKFTANLDSLEIPTDGGDFTVTVPAELTINNISDVVDFTINGNVSDEKVTATGSTKILMSEYGINPPSLVNVFTVDDEIELRFNLVATPEE